MICDIPLSTPQTSSFSWSLLSRFWSGCDCFSLATAFNEGSVGQWEEGGWDSHEQTWTYVFLKLIRHGMLYVTTLNTTFYKCCTPFLAVSYMFGYLKWHPSSGLCQRINVRIVFALSILSECMFARTRVLLLPRPPFPCSTNHPMGHKMQHRLTSLNSLWRWRSF